MSHSFSFQPPAYPVRRPEVMAAVSKQLSQDFTRLEGAPELEHDLQAWHQPDLQGRDPLVWYLSSGTAGLEAIMLGHGIGPGDEVITTPLTWGATVSAILAIGAIPRFADIDRQTGLIDPATIPGQITERTKAILVVHLFGHPCDVASCRRIADEHGLKLLEDGSQAHGARFAGRLVGDWGDAAAFSCMGMKLLAGTEGGYAIFRDPDIAETAYLYGKHPRGLDPQRVTVLEQAGLLDALQLGWRPCAVGAAIVQAALPYLDQENAARRANADTLRQALAECPWVSLPEELPQATGNYHLLSLLFDPECCPARIDRETFCQRLSSMGVETFFYIPTPLHRLKRLNPHGYEGPRVFWHDHLRQHGIDYRDTHCPAVDWRCQHSFEMGFNWIEPNPEAMQALAECFIIAGQP